MYFCPMNIIKNTNMAKIYLAALCLFCIFSCEQKIELAESTPNDRLNTAIAVAEENTERDLIMNGKTNKKWINFKEESENKMRELQSDLTKFDSSSVKVNEIDLVYLNYRDVKKDLLQLQNQLETGEKTFEKNRLRSRTDAFQDDNFFEENFKIELAEVDKSVQSLFAFNRSY